MIALKLGCWATLGDACQRVTLLLFSTLLATPPEHMDIRVMKQNTPRVRHCIRVVLLSSRSTVIAVMTLALPVTLLLFSTLLATPPERAARGWLPIRTG